MRQLLAAVRPGDAEPEAAGQVNEVFDSLAEMVGHREQACLLMAGSDISRKAAVAFRSDRYLNAEHLLRSALAGNPNELYARYLLGSLLFERGRTADAREQFDAICE